MDGDLSVLEQQINKQIGFQPGSKELHPQTPFFDRIKRLRIKELKTKH